MYLDVTKLVALQQLLNAAHSLKHESEARLQHEAVSCILVCEFCLDCREPDLAPFVSVAGHAAAGAPPPARVSHKQQLANFNERNQASLAAAKAFDEICDCLRHKDSLHHYKKAAMDPDSLTAEQLSRAHKMEELRR